MRNLCLVLLTAVFVAGCGSIPAERLERYKSYAKAGVTIGKAAFKVVGGVKALRARIEQMKAEGTSRSEMVAHVAASYCQDDEVRTGNVAGMVEIFVLAGASRAEAELRVAMLSGGVSKGCGMATGDTL